MSKYTIRNIAELIADNLGIGIDIDRSIIIDSIPDSLIDQIISDDQIEKIQELLNSDNEINNFGLDNQLGDNFDELKSNLGKLQMFALIKSLKKAEKCEEVLNTFIDLMNNKIGQVNNVLKSNLQFGGGQKNYYKKYKKYKIKYLFIKKYI
jgi:hypothetical protein